MRILCVCVAGFVLDAILGDPVWLYHPVRHLGIGLARDKPHRLKVLERGRQHLLRAVGHLMPQLVEPHHARLADIERIKHQQRPLVTKTAHHLPDGAGKVLGINFFLYLILIGI